MYFYILEGGTYDEYFKDIYFSFIEVNNKLLYKRFVETGTLEEKVCSSSWAAFIFSVSLLE